jgi:hypothetical protein
VASYHKNLLRSYWGDRKSPPFKIAKYSPIHGNNTSKKKLNQNRQNFLHIKTIDSLTAPVDTYKKIICLFFLNAYKKNIEKTTTGP